MREFLVRIEVFNIIDRTFKVLVKTIKTKDEFECFEIVSRDIQIFIRERDKKEKIVHFNVIEKNKQWNVLMNIERDIDETKTIWN